MENYSHQSSGDSSPLSREIDFENPDDNNNNNNAPSYKVKFMCSYGGKIQPRPHDNHHLSYVGGDTKILSVDRSASFSALVTKLSSICNSPLSDICFKYQLPGEELDSLISVTNDEDLEHLMMEYDRLTRSSPKPARLRIFLFPINSKPNSNSDYFFKEGSKPDGSWFVDALNSVQFGSLDNDNSPPPTTTTPVPIEPANPDFLFGFDKAVNYKDNYSAPDLNDQVAAPVHYYQPPPQAVPVPISAGYWPVDQQQHQQQPVYLIQTPSAGVYHQHQNASVLLKSGGPITEGERSYTGAHAGQGYYSVPQMPPQPSSLIRQPQQVGYVDGAGRPVYYTIAGGGVGPPPGYQMGTVVDGRIGMGVGVDSKAVGGNGPQNSSV